MQRYWFKMENILIKWHFIQIGHFTTCVRQYAGHWHSYDLHFLLWNHSLLGGCMKNMCIYVLPFITIGTCQIITAVAWHHETGKFHEKLLLFVSFQLLTEAIVGICVCIDTYVFLYICVFIHIHMCALHVHLLNKNLLNLYRTIWQVIHLCNIWYIQF